MKKKSRRPRTMDTSQQAGTVQPTEDTSEEKRLSGNRGRTRKTVPATTDSFCHDNAGTDQAVNSDLSAMVADDTQKPPQCKSRSSGECLRMLWKFCLQHFGKMANESLDYCLFFVLIPKVCEHIYIVF